MFLNFLFGQIPIKNLAYRINLMSAVFASFTVLLLYLVLQHLVHNTAIAFLTVLIFAFSRTFWSQAVVAEVYTLNACFLAVVILFFILWAQERRLAYFYAGCLLYAISFGNHLLMITVLPAIVVFVIVTDFHILRSKKTVMVITGCLLIGMLPYTYTFLKLQGGSFRFSVVRLIIRLYFLLSFVTGQLFRSKMFVFSL